jgi:hypothetical protein
MKLIKYEAQQNTVTLKSRTKIHLSQDNVNDHIYSVLQMLF